MTGVKDTAVAPLVNVLVAIACVATTAPLTVSENVAVAVALLASVTVTV